MADSGRGGRRTKRRSVDADVSGSEYRIDIASLGPEHRANALDESVPIAPHSHQRMARLWPVECPRFIHILETLGFHLIRHLKLIVHDPKLLTALVERWCPMTNTFHLPTGEMTITLQDVAVILGLRVNGPPVIGQMVVGPGLLWETWEDCCDELLGAHPDPNILYVDPDDQNNSAYFKMGAAETHAQLPLRWLRWMYCRESYDALPVQQIYHCVRAYILYMIGTLLLPDTSSSHVQLQYLPLLEDLDEFTQRSIGSSVLGNLYRELTLATRPKRTYIAGCLYLLQVWCWERIYVGRPTFYTPTDAEIVRMPLGARWNAVRDRELPACTTAMYRDMIDRLQQSQVCWTPYLEGGIMALLPDLCFEGINIWTARVPLISWKRVEWHLPDRVMRQFGSIQSIQIDPIERGFERGDGRGRAGTDWTHFHRLYIALWNDRQQYITPIIPPEGDGSEELMAYLTWYRSWASLYLVQPSTQPPDTYHPAGPTERLLMDYYVRSQSILYPWYGGTGENASGLQLAVDQVGALTERLQHQLHVDPSQYHVQGDMGASSSYQHREFGADTGDEDFQEQPPRARRARQPPQPYTPGSGALPPRRRRR